SESPEAAESAPAIEPLALCLSPGELSASVGPSQSAESRCGFVAVKSAQPPEPRLLCGLVDSLGSFVWVWYSNPSSGSFTTRHLLYTVSCFQFSPGVMSHFAVYCLPSSGSVTTSPV